MIKTVFIALICVAVVYTPAFAGGAGNCVRPIRTTTKYLGVGGAFEYNYVHERLNNLENKRGARGMRVDKLSQVYGKVIIGLFDYFNFYAKAGGTNYDLKFVDWPQDDLMEIDLEDGIYTGAGLNALFPLMDVEPFSLGLGLDIQGNFFLNDVKSITRRGQGTTNVDGSFYGVDGQNSIYLTVKYDIDAIKTSIVPYIGGYHSWIVVGTAETLSYSSTITGIPYDEEDYQAAFDVTSFGLLVGIDVDVAEFVNLNVEGRFIGETAITTGATIKF